MTEPEPMPIAIQSVGTFWDRNRQIVRVVRLRRVRAPPGGLLFGKPTQTESEVPGAFFLVAAMFYGPAALEALRHYWRSSYEIESME